MSLADELLADLEEAGDEDEFGVGNEGDDVEIEEITEDSAMELDQTAYDRVTSVARLRDSAKFREVLEKIEELADEECKFEIRGPVEANPEYQLVVEANNLAAEIDNEVNVIHKFVRDKYAKRFPELESLVPVPLEYLVCVKELGNDILTKGQNKDTLSGILLPATVIVLSVTASTTQGQPLTDDELAAVTDACDMAAHLQEAKYKIFQFVEQRMTFIAPNLSAAVGAGTAAMLMGQAGGLNELSKMPACNILLLGAQKRTLSGFSSTAILPHTGFVYYMPMVQSLPPDLRRKGARLMSAKCALASRVDAVHSSPDGSIGRKLLEEIHMKLEKMQEPPPNKAVKALPKPLDMASKKRGGRRMRKMKERLGMTDLRRKANRMNFGELSEDVIQTNIGFNVGQMKQSGGTGTRLRAPQVDQKTRVRMSKLQQRNMAKQQQIGIASVRSTGGATSIRSKQTAGTASSVTFTPVQGLEIVNPQAKEKKVAEANAKYFASTAAFVKIQTPLPGSTKDT